MAARKTIGLLETTRNKIRASMLINRLEDHAFAEVGPDGEILDPKHRMTPTQLKAIEVLLRKCLPDVASIQITNNTTHNHVVRLPLVAKTTDEWIQQIAEAQPDAEPALIELKPNKHEDDAA